MANQSSTATHFWPATFEERGVAVPFTTPSIAMARVRNGERGKLELVISGLSGGRGVYVIGWKGVRETFKLTVYDRVLHEHISIIEEVTPDDIHEAVLICAATGLAGEAVAEASFNSGGNRTEKLFRVSLALTRHVLKSVLDVDLDLSLKELATAAGQGKIQSQLGRIAKMHQIAPGKLTEALTEWSELLIPFGVPGYQPVGDLRRIFEDADHFLRSFRGWLQTSGLSEKHPAHLIADVLMETLPAWELAFGEIDALTDDPTATFRNWSIHKARLIEYSARIPWLLDGWPTIFAFWETALRGTQDQRLAAVNGILSGLPLLPKNEVTPNRHARWLELSNQLGIFAARNEMRGQNDIVLDGMLQQEQVLARTLG